jgi:hypothetical protein
VSRGQRGGSPTVVNLSFLQKNNVKGDSFTLLIVLKKFALLSVSSGQSS